MMKRKEQLTGGDRVVFDVDMRGSIIALHGEDCDDVIKRIEQMFGQSIGGDNRIKVIARPKATIAMIGV